MENIKIKNKDFKVISQMGDNSYHASFKNKEYFVRVFENKSLFEEYLDKTMFVINNGVKHPRIKYKDKKAFIIAEEFVEGDVVLDLLIKDDLKDEVYSQLFKNNFLARMGKISLDYDPINFLMGKDGALYYLSNSFKAYSDEESLTKKEIRLWFYTPEFVEYLKSKNLPIDQSRVKTSFVLNKEIVLKTVKYYR